MKMYKWYFEGQEIRFVSSEDKLERHINENRSTFDAHDKKVIIEHEYFDSIATPDAPCSTCGATTNPLPTLSLDDKKTKAKSKTVQLSGVSGDVADANPATDTLGNEPDLDLLNGSGERLAL